MKIYSYLIHFLIVINFVNCFAEECVLVENNTLITQIKCNYYQWLDVRETLNGTLSYYCCKGVSRELKQWLRDSLFRLAMDKGNPKRADRKCLLFVLCDKGCSDMVNYGVADTNPARKENDSKEMTEYLDAWYKGQEIAHSGNDKLCDSTCTIAYPDCNESNVWRSFYELGHKTGMIIFKYILYFMGKFSNQQTQRKVGERVLKYADNFYELESKLVDL